MSAALGIRVDQLTIRRGGSVLIDNLSLELFPGSFVGLIGPSGAGKSTLLRTIGLRPPSKRHRDSGIIATFSTREGPATRISGANHQDLLDVLSYVPQEDLLPEKATVIEVIQDALTFSGESLTPSEILTRVHLPDSLAAQQVSQLSGGERRRLSLARALASRPRILLLDEPTSGLDLPVAHEIMKLLRELCDQSDLTILTTSHLPGTLTTCHRILIMEKGGHLRADLTDPPHDLRETPEKDLFGLSTPIPELTEVDYQSHPSSPHESWQLSHLTTLLRRTFRQHLRDLPSTAVTLTLPIALAAIIIASQALHGKDAPPFINYFLSIAALWIGMSLTVREIVATRDLYAIDELSGLGKYSYFAAKSLALLFLALLSTLILCTSAWSFIALFNLNPDAVAASNWFDARDFVSHLLTLTLVALSGGMIGLLISIFAKSERGAVSLMPLVLLPHVLFSKYATGYAATATDQSLTHPFHSLSLPHFDLTHLSSLETANFWTGLLMSTRHATAQFDSLGSGLFSFSAMFNLDFWALCCLVAIQAFAAFLYFCSSANSALHRIR